MKSSTNETQNRQENNYFSGMDELIIICQNDTIRFNEKNKFHLEKDIACCLNDSIVEGSRLHLEFAKYWIQHIDLNELSEKSTLLCNRQSQFRGEELFAIVKKRIESDMSMFECYDENPIYFKCFELFIHLCSTIKTISGDEITQYNKDQYPSINEVHSAGLDLDCQGSYSSLLFEKIVESYENGDIVFKSFELRTGH